MLADWRRETTVQLGLAPGDVEELPLARTRLRWSDYRACVQAAADWAQTLGLGELLAHSPVALMACRGARYHHDAAQYGDKAFCNLFLSPDRGLDLHFPDSGQRLPLQPGLAALFDTAQAHGVIDRCAQGFDAADFADGQDRDQVFLSWELPMDDARVAQALGVQWDPAVASPRLPDGAQRWLHGAPAALCPTTGAWRPLETA